MKNQNLSILFLPIMIFWIMQTSNAQNSGILNKNTFGEIKARDIGPATMSGRIAALDAVISDPRIVYVGAANGGLWKSENAGTTFEPVFDEHNQAIGTICIDQQRPDTIWVGTGEVWVRNSVSVGDGIYRSTDGGKNWEKKGLEESERISKIIIHPENPDIVYAAVLGNLWNESEHRGLYKTIDGGNTWEKLLYTDENTGCCDLAMDPDNPDILYAGMWNFRRKPYFFRSGGTSSGLFKSIDAGKSWERVEAVTPTNDTTGRISVAFSPVDHDIIWALVESKKSALFRSDDNGSSWEKINDDPYINHRPFYFSLIVPDPVDTNRIYKPGFSLIVSDDGGAHFMSPSVKGGNYHSDIHALWIDPADNNFIYMGTDGGLYISYDRGNTWFFARSLPISTFYHVSVDDQKPYNVYGGLQDNGSWMAQSKSPGGITNKDWRNIGYGDGFNVLADKENPDILYWQYQGGNLKKKDLKTNEVKDIKPYADEGMAELRFNWNTPIVLSTSGNAIYTGSQYLHKSYDKGETWLHISDDLTTDDPDKLKQEETGGLTIDNSTAENHCTIFTIAESPLDSSIIWAGTDDGNLQITRNSGGKWKNVVKNIPDLPSATWCSYIEPSRFDVNTAWVTFDGHKSGDKNTYLFKTTDLGKTWKSIADTNIKGYCHVIKQDPVNPDLLFLGTEFGLFLTIDGGQNWVQFKGDVPNVSIRDMAIQERENDLVLGTHGRGILIIDDITPIRQLKPELLDQDFVYLESRPFEVGYLGYEWGRTGDDEFIGYNPRGSVQITYYLKKRHIFGNMYIEVFDNEGNMIKKLPAGKRKGINRISWPMRKKPPKVPSSVQILGQAFTGPAYPPGDYTIKITKGRKSYEGKVKVVYDKSLPHSVEDRDLRHKTIMKAYGLLESLAFIDARILDIKEKSEKKADEINDESLKKQLLEVATQVEILRKELLATRQGRITGERRLRERLGKIYGDVMSYYGRPTNSQIERLDNLATKVDDYEDKVNGVIEEDLGEINQKLESKALPPIKIITFEEFIEED